MKRSIFCIAILALCLSVSCKSDKKEETPEITEPVTEVESEVKETTRENNEPASQRPDYFDEKRTITVTLEPKSNSGVSGSVIFSQESGVVTMLAMLGGLTEGEHAIHIHETADCSSDDGKSSGGHWNPTGQPHGKWGDAAGYHKGDIGNFTANAEGKARITKVTDEWCIGCGDETKDILGKAVIVHQGIDDYKSQPSGAAGSRVSCGGIIE